MTQAKPALSLWIVEQRRAKKWKLEELARRLRDAGYEAADTTVRTWEAGRRPSAATIRGMELLFDASAPVDDLASTDMAALVRSISELAESIREERQARVDWEKGLLEALRDLAATRPGGAPSGGLEPSLPAGARR